MIRVTATVTGLSAFLSRIARTNALLSDTEQLNEIVANTFKQLVDKRFDSKTDPNLQPWAKWAPMTARMRRTTPGASLLVLTGDMRRSLSSNANASYAEVTISAPYASDHEFGVPSNNVPARQLFGGLRQLSTSDENAIIDALVLRLNAALST